MTARAPKTPGQSSRTFGLYSLGVPGALAVLPLLSRWFGSPLEASRFERDREHQ